MAVRAYRLAFEDIFMGEISRKICIPVYDDHKRLNIFTDVRMRIYLMGSIA